MIRYAAAALTAGVMLVSACDAQAQGQTKLKVGDAAPAFNALPGIDGKAMSLSDIKSDVLVVCITCNHCPVAVAYEDRLVEFVKKNCKDGKVTFVAINVNNNDQDKLDKMKQRAQERGFNFPYLYDSSQAIATALGAKVTPHFFVFNKERKLVYQGAMDNNNDANKATTNYLEPAVQSALRGETPSTTATNARGCGIQYERR
jgi:peroxiredoxin